MLNHSRRAPPPAPLIRLYIPNGEEGEAQLETRSSSASSLSSNSEPEFASSSGSESLGSFDEYPISFPNQHASSSCSSSSFPEKPYFQMRMKWLKGSASNKHDNLPTSASSISEFMIPSPQSPQTFYLDQQDEQDSHCNLETLPWRNENKRSEGQQDTNSVTDWMVKLTDTSYKDDGEVLLFFQSELEPGQQILDQLG